MKTNVDLKHETLAWLEKEMLASMHGAVSNIATLAYANYCDNCKNVCYEPRKWEIVKRDILNAIVAAGVKAREEC